MRAIRSRYESRSTGGTDDVGDQEFAAVGLLNNDETKSGPR